MPRTNPMNERIAKLETGLTNIEKHLVDIKLLIRNDAEEAKKQFDRIEKRFLDLDDKYDKRYTRKWVEQWFTRLIGTLSGVAIIASVATIIALTRLL